MFDNRSFLDQARIVIALRVVGARSNVIQRFTDTSEVEKKKKPTSKVIYCHCIIMLLLFSVTTQRASVPISFSTDFCKKSDLQNSNQGKWLT